MERTQTPGCWPLHKLSLFNSYYAIIDTEDYLADQLFINKKVRVWFGAEYICPDAPYRVIFCKCRKRNAEAFQDAMAGLPRKMLLCGHTDYVKFCEELRNKMEAAREHGGEIPNETACPSA